MNVIPEIGVVASPTHSASDLHAYENECRATLLPWLDRLLNMAELSGWNRRTAALTLMFLAARHASAAHGLEERKTASPRL